MFRSKRGRSIFEDLTNALLSRRDLGQPRVEGSHIMIQPALGKFR